MPPKHFDVQNFSDLQVFSLVNLRVLVSSGEE